MKKLLFFASDFKIGLSQLLSDQLLAIHDAGIDYIAIAGENEQEAGLTQKLDNAGISPIRIQGLDVHKDFKRLVNEIIKIIKNNNFEILHVQNNWQLALAYYAKLKLWPKHKIEIAYTLHGFRHNSPVKAAIAKIVIGSALFIGADHVICMTEYLKRNFKLLSYKIKIIPLGVNDRLFLNEFVTPNTDTLKLVFPAQFRHGKNQDVIIRAFAHFVDTTKDHNAYLSLPGNGPLLEECKQLTKQLGIEKQVSFPGFLSKSQIIAEYMNANIAIVASNSETFGQSIVEPYVLGRCLLSTPVGIATEIIQNYKNGWIFKNETELTNILLNIQSNRSQLAEIGKTNYDNRSQFAWSSIIDLYRQSIL